MATNLTDKMLELADKGHPRAKELREKAEAFDEAAKGFYSEPQTVPIQRFMKTWAQARILWCECSGEEIL